MSEPTYIHDLISRIIWFDLALDGSPETDNKITISVLLVLVPEGSDRPAIWPGYAIFSNGKFVRFDDRDCRPIEPHIQGEVLAWAWWPALPERYAK